MPVRSIAYAKMTKGETKGTDSTRHCVPGSMTLAAARNASCLRRVRVRRDGALPSGGDSVPMCQAGRPGSEVLQFLQVAAVLPLSTCLVAARQPASTPRAQALAAVPQTGARSHRDCGSRSWWQQHLERG